MFDRKHDSKGFGKGGASFRIRPYLSGQPKYKVASRITTQKLRLVKSLVLNGVKRFLWWIVFFGYSFFLNSHMNPFGRRIKTKLSAFGLVYNY